MNEFGIRKRMGWFYYLLIAICVWMSLTTLIQALKCDSMTNTQLFLQMPNAFVLNFKECQNINIK